MAKQQRRSTSEDSPELTQETQPEQDSADAQPTEQKPLQGPAGGDQPVTESAALAGGKQRTPEQIIEHLKGKVSQLEGELQHSNDVCDQLEVQVKTLQQQLEHVATGSAHEAIAQLPAQAPDVSTAGHAVVKGMLLIDIDGDGDPDQVMVSGINLPIDQVKANPGKFKNMVADLVSQKAFQGISKWLGRKLGL